MQNPLARIPKQKLNQSPAAEMHSPEPAIFVIFGITGNLAQHRLLPALYHLLKDNLLHEHTEIIGISRRDMSADDLLSKVELCVLESDKVCDPSTLAAFRKRLRMIKLDPIKAEDYEALHTELDKIEEQHGVCMNRLFYLSIPPQVYEPVIENFGRHHLNEGCQHHKAESRLLVEKPFGYDYTSAVELIQSTARYFSEGQIFRIDHYLAKDTAQNILVFREHNPIFASIWDNQHIQAIDLTFSEQIGIEGRSEFYDSVGALRDVAQNHLMQLLALTTMELPATLGESDALHRSKKTLLASVRPVDVRRHPVTRGQYLGYQKEVHNPGSSTETFIHLTLDIENKRWRGVPITMTAGKALDEKRVAVAVTFTPHGSRETNRLTFRIQPNEGIDIELTAKRPGFENTTEVVKMDFSYSNAFSESGHPDAYERVLVDAVRGDHNLFATSSEVLESWRILQPILEAWSMSDEQPIMYKPGSGGPA